MLMHPAGPLSLLAEGGAQAPDGSAPGAPGADGSGLPVGAYPVTDMSGYATQADAQQMQAAVEAQQHQQEMEAHLQHQHAAAAAAAVAAAAAQHGEGMGVGVAPPEAQDPSLVQQQ